MTTIRTAQHMGHFPRLPVQTHPAVTRTAPKAFQVGRWAFTCTVPLAHFRALRAHSVHCEMKATGSLHGSVLSAHDVYSYNLYHSKPMLQFNQSRAGSGRDAIYYLYTRGIPNVHIRLAKYRFCQFFWKNSITTNVGLVLP